MSAVTDTDGCPWSFSVIVFFTVLTNTGGGNAPVGGGKAPLPFRAHHQQNTIEVEEVLTLKTPQPYI
ncbi:hypothetical protein DPEC_G00157220 [Dallia pectoralis]|uniref:Uncharacterized protein n=1 Tax=Dallia pectoralis TaxID=75939 RepID=A0ACC2GLG9_DALPE|nr:hypothetical protein DPEC_G00157220 [Dallia pectoralis]